jgi:hypothetical protein
MGLWRASSGYEPSEIVLENRSTGCESFLLIGNPRLDGSLAQPDVQVCLPL